ncbi:glutaredoxin family protein [Bacillus cereus]|uniref:glutaredoxin family protein n=1 Tax=Bacillus cereus TaxID=1396 RepID=UPI0011A51876|nr:glutaredoxin [Bacillus cereus]
MKTVIVYTKNNCPECEKVKFNLQWLPPEVKESHTFEYRNIDENKTHAEDLDDMGYSSVPVTFIEGEEEERVVGFQMGELQDLFGI